MTKKYPVQVTISKVTALKPLSDILGVLPLTANRAEDALNFKNLRHKIKTLFQLFQQKIQQVIHDQHSNVTIFPSSLNYLKVEKTIPKLTLIQELTVDLNKINDKNLPKMTSETQN